MGEITPVTDHTIAEHLSQVPHAAALGMRLVGYEDGKALVRTLRRASVGIRTRGHPWRRADRGAR